MRDLRAHEDVLEFRQKMRRWQRDRDFTDELAEMPAPAKEHEEVVQHAAGDQSQQGRGDRLDDARTQQNHNAGDHPYEQGERLHRSEVRGDAEHRDRLVEPEHAVELGAEDQDRRRILKAGDDRRRSVFHQAAQAQEPEKRLKAAPEEHQKENESEQHFGGRCLHGGHA